MTKSFSIRSSTSSRGIRRWGPATTLYYESVLKGRVIDPSPIMDWQRAQATIFRDKNGNMHFVKPGGSNSSSRIDGIDQSLFGLKVLADNMPTIGSILKINRRKRSSPRFRISHKKNELYPL